jgi:hypothetical protein
MVAGVCGAISMQATPTNAIHPGCLNVDCSCQGSTAYSRPLSVVLETTTALWASHTEEWWLGVWGVVGMQATPTDAMHSVGVNVRYCFQGSSVHS